LSAIADLLKLCDKGIVCLYRSLDRRLVGRSEAYSSFTGRVQALAKAHTCSPRTKMQGADVMELVSEQVLIGAPNDSQTLDHLCGVCVRVRLLYFHRK
jgi:HWE histidine kinase